MSREPPSEPRLWEIYERAFRSLMWRVQPRGLQAQIDRLLDQARRQVDRGTAAPESLQCVYDRARAQIVAQLEQRSPTGPSPTGGRAASAAPGRVHRVRSILERGVPTAPIDPSPDFHCDAGLGGLARWLRAAGYDAAWWPGIDDGLLVQKASDSIAVMLTTDRPLMRRGAVTKGAIAALLVPNGPSKRHQLAFVVSKLDLPRKDARCMNCGGRLRQVDKRAVKDRIPPRTYPWRDDYFLCGRCNKLFWPGTHWSRISQELARV